MYETIFYNVVYYQRYFFAWWDQMGPYDYATVLTLIGVLGWYWMRGHKKL